MRWWNLSFKQNWPQLEPPKQEPSSLCSNYKVKINALNAHITSHHTIKTHHIYQNIRQHFGFVHHAQTSVLVFSRKFCYTALTGLQSFAHSCVSLLSLFPFPCITSSIQFAFCTHNATHFVFKLRAVRFMRGVYNSASFTNIMVEQLLKVTSEYEEWLRRCEYIPRFSFGCRMLTVLRIDFSSCTFFVNNQLQFSSWRTSDWFRVRFSAKPAVEIWRGPQIPLILKVFVGGVKGRLLGSGAISLHLSRKGRGSSRVNSPYRKFCSLLTTPCAANKPPGPKANIAWVHIWLQTGACSAGKPCWYF
jgi:hypothetical protein